MLICTTTIERRGVWRNFYGKKVDYDKEKLDFSVEILESFKFPRS